MLALDLFCGGGGVSVGLERLGYEVVGVDIDDDALCTHEAAGHESVKWDLSQRYVEPPFTYDLVWASPPCTAFSNAGKRDGHTSAADLADAIKREDWDWGRREGLNPNVWLVLPTMETILHLLPKSVAMENVPQAGTVIDACLRVLERYGYRGDSGKLYSEEFGVAQTRTRYFLAASRVWHSTGSVKMPKPTHAKYTHPKNRKKARQIRDHADAHGLRWWISMAEALGWGTPERPYFTLALGGDSGDTTGGGSGARKSLSELAASGAWVKRDVTALDRRCQQAAPGGRGREMVPVVPIGAPSPSLTSIGLSGPFVWRREDESDQDETLRLTMDEAARLQAFPDKYPWQGSKTAVLQQIGNAVPPPMAIAVAGAASGLVWQVILDEYLRHLYAEPLPSR